MEPAPGAEQEEASVKQRSKFGACPADHRVPGPPDLRADDDRALLLFALFRPLFRDTVRPVSRMMGILLHG
jgi:hypothetical protein